MTAGRPATAILHLVPHTHWDREWYEPFQRFRLRLVDLVDGVLDRAEADRRFRFTFDGQTAMLDDYLEIRPEAEPRLRALVQAGQLAVGPWHILSDEFLVGGEALVRNLELGLARGEQLGGAMAVGYLPDMFGHTAQMPQLLRRAGLEHAAVWRGVPAAVDRHAFRWVAPDGSSVRTEYLVGGYSNAAGLFAHPARLDRAVARLHQLLGPFFGHDRILAMYGTDHSTPLPDLLEVVDRLNRAQDRYRVRVDTLAAYIVRAGDGDGLPVWHGELRSGARANLLMGVTSARVQLKAAFALAERLLARYAEPFQALHGRAWPEPFLALGWRRLVESSGHDSITGCGADEVADQVAVRLAEAAQLGAGLAERVAAEVAGRVPRGAAAVLNPSPFRRAGLVDLDLAVPDGWDEVALELPDGRLVATQEAGRSAGLLHTEELPGTRLAEAFGRVHGRRLLGRFVNGVKVEDGDGGRRLTFEVDDHPDPLHLDMDQLAGEIEVAAGAAAEERFQLRVVAPPRRRLQALVPAPALGWTAAAPRPGRGELAHPVTGGPRWLDNGLVAAEVAGDGTLRLRGSGVTLQGVARLVDGGDAGDLYNYAPPAADRLVAEPDSVAVTVLASGPVRGELLVERDYGWPLGLDPAGTARSEEPVAVRTATSVELRAGEPFLRLLVTFDNRARDHRLRLHVPLAGPAAGSFAEGQFAVVERGTRAEGGHGEEPLATYPASGFVDAGGAAVLLDHVTEYELLPDPPELALTLLRAVGQISRNVHRFRQEPAGPETPTPRAQCLGPVTGRLAVYPHPGAWHRDGVLEQMERYRHDLLVAPGTARRARPDRPEAAPGANLPAEVTGLAVEGDGVVLSALRRRGEWLELRLTCQRPAPVTATVTGAVVEARQADLLGRPGPALPVRGGALRVDLAAWEVRTVHLRRRPSSTASPT
jgi:mannosylglycerate hydrolase